MKFRKVGIPTLSKSIPTLRTEFISSLFHFRILELSGTILESADKVGIPTLRRCNCTDSYFAQNICINNPGHITKMAAMPYLVKPFKNLLPGTGGPISMKLGMNY